MPLKADPLMVVPPAAGGAVLACAVLLWIGSLIYPSVQPASLTTDAR